MAGDWIKFETCTFEKPEVIAIADALDIPEIHVVGCLLMVWAWFDQQTENGHAPSVTKKFIDRKAGVTGFADAMLSTGWLTENDDHGAGLTMPNFERHNGKSAKKRALATARKQIQRSRIKRDENGTGAGPEKRREENIYNPPTPLRGGAVDKSTKEKSNGRNPPQQVGNKSPAIETQISKCWNPGRLSQLCRHYGFGDPPAGMGFDEAKAWAVAKAQKQTREENHA